MRDRTLVIAAVAAGSALVTASAVTWSAAAGPHRDGKTKTVQLALDGSPREVSSQAATVGALLREQSITVGAHDVVAPAIDRPLADGDRVVVRFGRLLTLQVDGREQQVWTTARTVDEALDQVGVRLDGAYLSASRSMPLGRQGLHLDVRLRKDVTVVADGQERPVSTTAATVGSALDDAGIELGPADLVSIDPSAALVAGSRIVVRRVTTRTTVVEQPLAFRTVTKKTATLYRGSTKVAEAGANGTRRLTYADTYTDGVRTARELVASEIVTPAVDRIVLVGTKVRAGTYGSVSGVAGLNWAALARCESSGNPRAVNPAGYYGLYQFTVSTWRSVGGSGLPSDAPAAEQTYRAQLLYKRSGAGQWPHCGRYLFT